MPADAQRIMANAHIAQPSAYRVTMVIFREIFTPENIAAAITHYGGSPADAMNGTHDTGINSPMRNNTQ